MPGGDADLNCTVSNRVEASPDIAGIGVLVAFLLSALLTLGAVVFSYLSESLPEEYLSEIDQALINWVQFNKSLDHIKSKLTSVKARIAIRFGWELSPRGKLTRKDRQEALTRFILALSDQQLVTGFAVLVGAIANQRTITMYDFRVTFGLAWFSATTHLATLDVLRDYFMAHKTVWRWRLCGMVSVLVLLLYTFFLATVFSAADTVPMQCVFQVIHYTKISDVTTGNYTTGVDVTAGVDVSNPFIVVTTIITISILLTSYWTRIQWSRGKSKDEIPLHYVFVFRVRAIQLRLRQVAQISTTDQNLLLRELKSEQSSTIKRQQLERIGNGIVIMRFNSLLGYALNKYSQSFLSMAPKLIFMLSFGFAQLVFKRWANDIPVDVDNSMGFGQITPICLLVLPALAAAETYYGKLYAAIQCCYFLLSLYIAEDLEEAKLGETTGNSQNEIPPRESSAGNSSTIQRADTIPVTPPSSDSEFDSISRRGLEYDNVVGSIKVFFYAQTQEVQKEWGLANTADELLPVLRKKNDLLDQYKALTEIERTNSSTINMITFGIFAIASLLCIAMGFLLNAPTGDPTAVIWGVATTVLYYYSDITSALSDAIYFGKAITEESVTRILSEIEKSSASQDDSSSQSAASGTDAIVPPRPANYGPESIAGQGDIPMQDIRQRSGESIPSI